MIPVRSMPNQQTSITPPPHPCESCLLGAGASFHSLFWKAPTPIYLHDIDSLDLLECNPAAWASYGVNSREAFDATNMWMDPPYAEADALAWMHRAMAEGLQCYEWCCRDVHGALFWEELRLLTLPIRGVERIAVFATDITERKRAESCVREAIGMVAHDLRNPLSGIQAMAALVEENTPPETLRRHLHLIGTSAGASMQFVQDLLEFSRSDLHIQDRQSVDLALLLPELGSRLVPQGISILF